MKLRQIKTEVALFELRIQIGDLLIESISDYLSMTVAMLKNDKSVDLDQLAELVAGLRILGNSDHRESITKDDIGINPNSFKELFNTLNSITRDGKQLPKMTAEVFAALKSISPSTYKKTRAEFEVLENGTKSEKARQIQALSAFATKVNQLFYKVKHGATMPKEKAVVQAVGDAYDNVGGVPA